MIIEFDEDGVSQPFFAADNERLWVIVGDAASFGGGTLTAKIAGAEDDYLSEATLDDSGSMVLTCGPAPVLLELSGATTPDIKARVYGAVQ